MPIRAILRWNRLRTAWHSLSQRNVLVRLGRQLLCSLSAVSSRHLLSQRRHCHSNTMFAGLYYCRQWLYEYHIMLSLPPRNIFLKQSDHGTSHLRTMPSRSVLWHACSSVSVSVPCGRLLQRSRRFAARDVSAWYARAFDWRNELFRLSCRHILQLQRYCAA